MRGGGGGELRITLLWSEFMAVRLVVTVGLLREVEVPVGLRCWWGCGCLGRQGEGWCVGAMGRWWEGG